MNTDAMDFYYGELGDDSWLNWLMAAEAAHCDHEWETYSDIGPDSGSEYFQCRKCGEAHDVIWY